MNTSATPPRYTLMTPGPVPLPQEVLENLALPMDHHRTPEFVALFGRVLTRLKDVFLTKQPVFIQTSTGSGGMESALVNCISPGDKVLAIVSGKFGERWAEMAETFGAKVTRLNVEWGKAVNVHDVEAALAREPDTVAVMSQACETSTGVLHPVREIARIVSKTKAIFMCDAITALGALQLPMDEWGIDVLVAGSQKAFMLPTGVAFISFSPKAWKLTETAKCPKFYFDMRREKKANEAGESYFSTPVSHVRALDLVLRIFLDKGMNRVYERIQTLSKATIIGAREMGLEIFPEVPSPSLTAIRLPDGVDGQKVRSEMESGHHVVVMGGQDQLKGKIIRIGHMGAISDEDVAKTFTALAKSLNKLKPGCIPDEKLANALTRSASILKEAPAV